MGSSLAAARNSFALGKRARCMLAFMRRMVLCLLLDARRLRSLCGLCITHAQSLPESLTPWLSQCRPSRHCGQSPPPGRAGKDALQVPLCALSVLVFSACFVTGSSRERTWTTRQVRAGFAGLDRISIDRSPFSRSYAIY